MAKTHTTLDLDHDLLHEAAEALGTSRTTETVHAALREVVGPSPAGMARPAATSVSLRRRCSRYAHRASRLRRIRSEREPS